MKTIIDRVRSTVGVGLTMAAVYSVIASLVWIGNDGVLFESDDVSLFEVIGLYLASGLIGGALCGLLLPIARWRLGAVLLGVIVALPIYGGAAVLLDNDRITTSGKVILALIVSALVGGGVGLWRWYDEFRPGATDHIEVIATRSEAPRLRIVQMIGLSIMVVGVGTCTVFAASDAALLRGTWLFLIGAGAVLVSQLMVWTMRLFRALS
jgi:hypothetical protein